MVFSKTLGRGHLLIGGAALESHVERDPSHRFHASFGDIFRLSLLANFSSSWRDAQGLGVASSTSLSRIRRSVDGTSTEASRTAVLSSP